MLRIVILLISFCIATPVVAWTHGKQYGSPYKAQMNLGPGEGANPQTYVNVLKSLTGDPTLTTVSSLDTSAYPINTLSSEYAFGSGGRITLSAGPWKLFWDAGRSNFKVRLFTEGTVTCTPVTNATVTGCGASNTYITGDGINAGSVQLTFSAPTFIIFIFQTDGTYSAGSGEMALIRVSDQARYDAGEYFTTEFIDFMKSLSPGAIRNLGLHYNTNLNFTNTEIQWAYRPKVSDFSWNVNRVITSAWSGGPNTSGNITTPGSGAGQVGQYTAAAATDTPLSGWVDGEVLLGKLVDGAPTMTISGTANNAGNVRITVASTAALTSSQTVYITNVVGTTEANGIHTITSVDSGTTFTIDVPYVNAYVAGGAVGYQKISVTGKSGGAKHILSNQGYAPGYNTSGLDNANSYYQFWYDSVLDAVLYVPGLYQGSMPIEAQAQLANRINADLWFLGGGYATLDWHLQAYNLLYSLLDTSLLLKYEYANEVWNQFFPIFHYAVQRGNALGGINYYSLRVRQVMGLAQSTNWMRTNRLRRVYSVQGIATTAQYVPLIKGTGLVSPGTAAYQTFVGGSAVNYNTYPNCPGDFVEEIASAPYTYGLSLGGQSPDAPVDPTTKDLPALQAIADNWIAGNTAVSNALVNDRMTTGRNEIQTVTASGTTFTTSTAHGLSVGEPVRFDSVGGTSYSGINNKTLYTVLTTPTTTTFTIAAYNIDAKGTVPINAGSGGTGTTNVGSVGTSSFFAANGLANYYVWIYRWQIAAEAITPRPPGMLPMKTSMYEGALEPTAPSAAQATAIGLVTPSTPVPFTGNTNSNTTINGIASTAGLYVGMVVSGTDIPANTTISAVGANSITINNSASGTGTGRSLTASGTSALASSTINAAINTGWKNSSYAKDAANDYFKIFVGTQPNYFTYGLMTRAYSPSWLVLLCPSAWSLVNGCALNTTPYKTFDGFAQFSTGN